MKKVFKIVLAFLLVLIICTTVAKATSTDDLVAYASKTFTIAGKQVKLSNSDILKVKRYFSENPVSESDANKIMSKADQIISIMNSAGVSDLTKLSKAKKDEIIKIAQEAAAITGATLTYDSKNKTIEMYKNGKKIESISIQNNNKFVQTGNDNTLYVVLGSIGVIAIIAVATKIYRKKKANV